MRASFCQDLEDDGGLRAETSIKIRDYKDIFCASKIMLCYNKI